MDLGERCRELIARKGTVDEAQRLRELFDLDWRWTMEEHPEFATYVGHPGHDHRWSDRSLDGIERRKRGVRHIAEAARSIDRARLGPPDLLDHDLFARHTDEELEGQRFPGEYLAVGPMSGPQADLPQVLQLAPAHTVEDLEHAVARLDAIPAVIEQHAELLRAGLATGITVPRVTLAGVDEQIAAHATGDPAASPLLTAFRTLPPGGGRLRDEAVAIVRDKVAPAYRAFGEFFEREYVPGCRETIALSALPDGEEWYAHVVRRFTTTTLTPKDIHEIGLREVERIRAEMNRVVATAGFDGSFEEFLEFLRTDPRFFFDDAEDLLTAYRDIAKRADPELIKLFGTLPRTPYGVAAVPDYLEKTSTTAYYQPGSAEAGRPGYFYANTYDLMSRPSWEMEALTLHEAVPGHHLQIALAQELPAVPEFRRHAGFTAFVEGWGLYSESLGEEMGFYADPYAKFGQLTYEVWRAIRLVVDTGMHAFGWSREKAISYFHDNAGKADHDITVEVDRYISWPGQALAYKIGELKLKELRARATAALGDGFDLRAFHDVVLGNGSLPLDVLEPIVDRWIDERRVAGGR